MCNVGKKALTRHANTECPAKHAYSCSLFVDITTVFIHSVSGQHRPRSACANAQADQGLRCSPIAQGPFSCVAHQLVLSFACFMADGVERLT